MTGTNRYGKRRRVYPSKWSLRYWHIRARHLLGWLDFKRRDYSQRISIIWSVVRGKPAIYSSGRDLAELHRTLAKMKKDGLL